uniref:Uncharacterized protein n=1 Tax=Aegilops tauschii TaxID=37682 RepID=N1QZ07_AEGTA
MAPSPCALLGYIDVKVVLCQQLLSPCSSFLPPSLPPQLASTDEDHHEVLEFASCKVPEQWLLGYVVVTAKREEEDYF